MEVPVMAGTLALRLILLTFTLICMDYTYSQRSSNEPQSSCMSYLGEKLSNRYSSVQMEHACKRYATWGNMMKSGPKVQMKERQREYWGHLHESHSAGPGVRKEYRMLTDIERRQFHQALNTLKNSMVGDMSRYDVLVGFHQPSFAPGAHFGPAFAGWHREFLFRMEQALREIDSRVSLPYWDSTMDEVLGEEARKSVMWTDAFAGNLDGDVVTGPFRNWDIFYEVQNRTKLFRQAVPEGGLFTDDVINDVIDADTFRDITWFIDPTFEFVHGMVHDWVGGVLGDLGVSPADPVFFLHHGFVDCTFEWHRRDKAQRGSDVRYTYPNDSMAHGVGIVNPLGDIIERVEDSFHLADIQMDPFQGLLNIDGLSHEYNRYYKCAPRPSCSKRRPKCGSAYLFCETKKEKCAPKLTEGAKCAKWRNMNPCYKGTCCKGVCSKTCSRRRTPSSSNRYKETVYRHNAPVQSPRPSVAQHPNNYNNNRQPDNEYQQPTSYYSQPSNHYPQETYQHQPINSPPSQYNQEYQPENHGGPPPAPPPPSHPPNGGLYPSHPNQGHPQRYSPWQPYYPVYA